MISCVGLLAALLLLAAPTAMAQTVVTAVTVETVTTVLSNTSTTVPSTSPTTTTVTAVTTVTATASPIITTKPQVSSSTTTSASSAGPGPVLPCYEPNGTVMDSLEWQACDQDAGHSQCCNVGLHCTDGGLCASIDAEALVIIFLSRGGCTDPSWTSNACPPICNSTIGKPLPLTEITSLEEHWF